MLEKEEKEALRNLPYPYNIMEMVREKLEIEKDPEHRDFTVKSFSDCMDAILTPTEIKILALRFGSNKSLNETAQEVNVSKERVRQKENVAFNKLTKRSNTETFLYYPPDEHDKRLMYENLYKEAVDKSNTPAGEIIDERADSSKVLVVRMAMSVRATNCMLRAGIRTLHDIIDRYESPEQMKTTQSLGTGTFNEIVEKVHAYGYKMRWEEK